MWFLIINEIQDGAQKKLRLGTKSRRKIQLRKNILEEGKNI